LWFHKLTECNNLTGNQTITPQPRLRERTKDVAGLTSYGILFDQPVWLVLGTNLNIAFSQNPNFVAWFLKRKVLLLLVDSDGVRLLTCIHYCFS
jgi:hypothetical protein